MAHRHTDAESRPRCHVLLVDDDADVRLLWRLVLEGDDRFGSIHEAASGEEALSSLAEHGPDVVLTDLRLDGISGFELLTVTRQDHPETVVVVTSGSDDAEAEALQRGAAAFIAKEDTASTRLADVLADRLGHGQARPPQLGCHPPE